MRKYLSTKLILENCYPQCEECNSGKYGMETEFAEYLGPKLVAWLKAKKGEKHEWDYEKLAIYLVTVVNPKLLAEQKRLKALKV